MTSLGGAKVCLPKFLLAANTSASPLSGTLGTAATDMLLSDFVTTLLPVTSQGSYPRPRWHRFNFSTEPTLACLQREDFAESYRDAVSVVVGEQDRSGLDIPAPGFVWYDDEATLASSFLYNVRRLGGVEVLLEPHPILSRRAPPGERPSLHAIAGVTAAVTGPLCDRGLGFELHWRIAQDATAKPVKAQFGMGPMELGGILVDRYYGSWRRMIEALVGVYNLEMKAAVASGARVVQLDDNLIMTPPERWDEAAELLSLAFEGVNAYRILQVTHGGTGVPPAITPYVKMFPSLRQVHCECLAFSSAQTDFRDDEFEAWKGLAIDKDLGLGAVSNKNFYVETPAQVAAGIHKALRVVPPERLLVTTDAGLIRYPRSIAHAKLQALVAGAQQVRAELGLSSP